MNVYLFWSNGEIYWDCGNDGLGYDCINKVVDFLDFEGCWNYWVFIKDVVVGIMFIYFNGELWYMGIGFICLIMVIWMIVGQNVFGGNFYFGDLDNFSMWQ